MVVFHLQLREAGEGAVRIGRWRRGSAVKVRVKSNMHGRIGGRAVKTEGI